MALTYDGANALLTCLCGKSGTYPYSSVYVGLSTTPPSADGQGITEPSGNGYGRVLLGVGTQESTQKMSTPAYGQTANTEIVYFPEATGNWGECTHFCLFSAETGGTCIAYGQLTNAIRPENQTVPIIRVGAFTMQMT